jgi:hypothetical protein
VLLRRTGAEFVERFEAHQGVQDTEHLLQAVQRGHSLVFFLKGPLVGCRVCKPSTWVRSWLRPGWCAYRACRCPGHARHPAR